MHGCRNILNYACNLIFLDHLIFHSSDMNIALYNSEYLNFVEFNITGDNNNFHRCDLESRYLDTEIFNLFQSCFENANKTFDYFAGSRYNSRTIIVLRNELFDCLELFNKSRSVDDFTGFISNRFMGKDFLALLELKDKQWKNNWQDYQNKIIKILKDLIELAEKCAFEERILWVIGY